MSETPSIDVPQAPGNMVLLKKGWIVFKRDKRTGKTLTSPFKAGAEPTIYIDKAYADGIAELNADDANETRVRRASLYVEAEQ